MSFSPLSSIAQSLHLSPRQARAFAEAAQRTIPEFLQPDSPRYRNFTFSTANQLLALEEVAEEIGKIKTQHPGARFSVDGLSQLFIDKFTHYTTVDSRAATEKLRQRTLIPDWMGEAFDVSESFPTFLTEDAHSIAQRINENKSFVASLEGRTIIDVDQNKDGTFVSKNDPDLTPDQRPPSFVSRLRDGASNAVSGYQDFARKSRIGGFAVAGGEVAIGSTLLYRGGTQLYNAFGASQATMDSDKKPSAAAKLWAAVQAISGVALTALGIYTGTLAYQGRGR